jgi:hypothetical protein
MRVLLACSAIALLSACASTGGNRYEEDYDRLRASCDERGGTLRPTSSPTTGRPETDYTCLIVGGSSDRIRPAN